MNIRSLCDELRQPGARVGIGVWLMPREYIGKEEAVAARLDVQAQDARQAYLQCLPSGARFSGLTRPDGYQNLIQMLRKLTTSTYNRDCLLVHTLDLLLLALEVNEREYFWRDALEGLPYPRTKLILSIPEQATELFSYDLQRRYSMQLATGSLD